MHHFQLVGEGDQPVQAKFKNVTATPELHGPERVRAVYIRHTLAGTNRLLDLIQPGLRAHHYCNKQLEQGQGELPMIDPELPDLRMPQVDDETTHKWDAKPARGYRWIRDFGLGDAESNLDLTDCVVSKIEYTTNQGGTVTVEFTVAYNGDDLNDNTLHGRILGLATDGDGYIKLIAPATLVEPKKGWRSGHQDPKPATDGDGQEGQGRIDGDGDGGEDGDSDLPEGSPEAALAGTVKRTSRRGKNGAHAPQD